MGQISCFYTKVEVSGETKKIQNAIKLKKVDLHYKIIKSSLEIKQHHDQQLGKGMYTMIPFFQTECPWERKKDTRVS